MQSGRSALRPDGGWRDAHELLRSDEGTDLLSRLEAAGADPLIVAGYVRLLRAIFDGVPRDLGKQALLKERET